MSEPDVEENGVHATRSRRSEVRKVNKPIRCCEGKMEPHEPFWKIRNAGGPTQEAEIELYGAISEFSWLDDNVTPKLFKAELDKLEGRPVTLRINSVGGDVIAASTIRAMLTEYPGKVTARIDGVCSSAATVVALAASRIKMQDTAFFMIHDPSVVLFMAELDIADMQSLLDALKSVKGGLVDAYEARTGLSRARIEKMMSDTTWMNASEAVKFGFADESISGGVASANANVGNMVRNLVNVPVALLNQIEEPVNTIEQLRNAAEARALQDEVNFLK